MSPSLKNPLRHPHGFSSQFHRQDLTVWNCDQIVCSAVYHQNPLAPNFLRNLLQLLRTFLVPPCSQGLADEALASEARDVMALGELLSREAVAVGGVVAIFVGLGEPRLADSRLDLCDLLIERLGDTRSVNELQRR